MFWPQVLLPSIIPDADIYTWGYDADVDKFGSASQNTIHQHATSLLSDLADLQESLGSVSAFQHFTQKDLSLTLNLSSPRLLFSWSIAWAES